MILEDDEIKPWKNLTDEEKLKQLNSDLWNMQIINASREDKLILKIMKLKEKINKKNKVDREN